MRTWTVDVGLADLDSILLSVTHLAVMFGGGAVTFPVGHLKPHPTGNRAGRERRPRPPTSIHWCRQTQTYLDIGGQTN